MLKNENDSLVDEPVVLDFEGALRRQNNGGVLLLCLTQRLVYDPDMLRVEIERWLASPLFDEGVVEACERRDLAPRRLAPPDPSASVALHPMTLQNLLHRLWWLLQESPSHSRHTRMFGRSEAQSLIFNFISFILGPSSVVAVEDAAAKAPEPPRHGYISPPPLRDLRGSCPLEAGRGAEHHSWVYGADTSNLQQRLGLRFFEGFINDTATFIAGGGRIFLLMTTGGD